MLESRQAKSSGLDHFFDKLVSEEASRSASHDKDTEVRSVARDLEDIKSVEGEIQIHDPFSIHLHSPLLAFGSAAEGEACHFQSSFNGLSSSFSFLSSKSDRP